MQTTNEEVWEVKAKETWIDSFLSCHHQLPEKCNCPEQRRELKMYIDKLLSTQEEKIRKEIQKEIDFYQEGIDACVEDSKMTGETAPKGNELHYMLGKVRTLRLLKPRLEQLLNNL